MHRKYNIYDMMLRAAAGDPPSGGAGDDDQTGDDTSNAKTINADDPDDDKSGEGADTLQAGSGDDTLRAGEGDDTLQAGGGDDQQQQRKPAMVPRDAVLKRVGELTKKNSTLQAEIDRLKAAGTAPVKPEGDDPPDDGEAAPKRSEFKTEAEFNAAVEAEAEKRVDARIATQQFNQRCNAVADAGEKAYAKDWDDTVANLRMLGDDGNIPKMLLDAALEADDPAAALHHLGQDPEEAMRILSLPPIQQIAQVVKHGVKKAKAAVPKPKTGAPDPIEPLGGGGEVGDGDGLTDDVDDETWLRNRNAQVQSDRLAAARRGGTSH